MSEKKFLPSVDRPSAHAITIKHFHSSVDCTSEFFFLYEHFKLIMKDPHTDFNIFAFASDYLFIHLRLS